MSDDQKANSPPFEIAENKAEIQEDAQKSDSHPPLKGALKGALKGTLKPVEFEEWFDGVSTGQNEFLSKYKALAEKVFERSCEIRRIMIEKGLEQGSASQILPNHLTINALASRFGVSASTVQSVKRVVDSIPINRLPTLISEE